MIWVSGSGVLIDLIIRFIVCCNWVEFLCGSFGVWVGFVLLWLVLCRNIDEVMKVLVCLKCLVMKVSIRFSVFVVLL